jgi:chromatin remodeling complex protein RSC6
MFFVGLTYLKMYRFMYVVMADNASTTSETKCEDKLGGAFKTLESSLSAFRSEITKMQAQLRTLERTVNKEMKSLRKETARSRNKGNRQPSGFAKATKISDELCAFMGKESGSEVARTEVTQFVIQYIKEHNLAQSREISPDTKLAALLGVGDKDDVTYFNIQRYMNRHFKSAKAAAKTSGESLSK